MQSKLTILLLSACIFLFAQVQAACTCDANDQTCLQTCVTQGQGCITACNGDTGCYDQCIAEYWPGQSVASSTSGVATTASATASVSAAPSTTVAATTTTAASVPVSSPVSSAPVASTSAPVVSSSAPVNSASSPVNSATFSPTAPTSANPPQTTTTESGAQSSFLVPAVAIGVASVTVITQFFFLARMGSVLFN